VLQRNANFLNNFEASQNQSEGGRFEKRHGNKGFSLEFVGEMQLLSEQHDFAKGQRVD
jgi:hypothetical protein